MKGEEDKGEMLAGGVSKGGRAERKMRRRRTRGGKEEEAEGPCIR